MPVDSFGQQYIPVSSPAFAGTGYQKISNPVAATGLTVPTLTTQALVQCLGGQVRWRADGVNPVAGTGGVLIAGDALVITGTPALTTVKFIADSGSPELNITYWG